MSFLGGQYSSRNIGCSCIICNCENNQYIVVSGMSLSIADISLFRSVFYLYQLWASGYIGQYYILHQLGYQFIVVSFMA